MGIIVALSGSFDVVIDDGKVKKTYSLNRSYYGLYVPKMMWRQMVNFSTNSLALNLRVVLIVNLVPLRWPTKWKV